MNCDVCGGTKSYIQDGVEYCAECSNQFKGSQEETAAEESFSKRTVVSPSPSTKKGKKSQKKKMYSPWLSFDVYNLILSKQVSALIKLGCSENLKTVVLYLWARYLQTCQVAFIKHYNDDFKPRLSIYPLRRDVELLYGKGLTSRKQKSKNASNKKSKKANDDNRKKSRKKKLLEETSESEAASDFEDNLTENEENTSSLTVENLKNGLPTDSSASDPDVSGGEISVSTSLDSVKKRIKKTVPLYSPHARKLMKKKWKKASTDSLESCLSHMTISKTIAFCQLGLLYTEDQLLLFDLLRLVNEGIIPFIDATRHFPKEMQLQKEDASIFTKYAAPDIKRTSLTAAQLINFLNLPKFKEPSLLPIAIRFVKDLNLPCGLVPVLKLLISKLREPSDDQFELKGKENAPNSIPIYEAEAMSVIAIALKMLFVLDGNFEVEHSEIMTKINAINKKNKFFVWKDWQRQMTLKEYLFLKKYNLHENTLNRLDGLVADRITGGYPINMIRPDLAELSSKATQDELAARLTLKKMVERVTLNDAIKKNPTSFPLQYELQRLMDEWKNYSLFKKTDNLNFDFISQDFSHHKLYYRPSVIDSTSDEPTSLLLSYLYESIKLVHVGLNDELYENIIRTSKKYWHVNHSVVDILKGKSLEDLPSTFNWLLSLMSKYLQIDSMELYREFRIIERKLFVE